MKRTQIYLADEQRLALTAMADKLGTTASALIRDAIDGFLIAQSAPHEQLARLRALGQRLSRAEVPGLESSAIVEELRAAGAERIHPTA